MTSITLITARSEQPRIRGRTGVLCEMAPDGTLAKRHPEALTIAELIGDFSETKQCAANLAWKLLADEPPLRGVQQLRVFEELVIREFQHITHAINLYETLCALGVGSCEFSGPSRYASILSSLIMRTGSKIIVSAPGVGDNSILQSLKRSWYRVQDSGLSWEMIGRELRLVLERVDPFHTLPLWRNARANWQPGETWFYSTAVTFTNIGLLYEPYFPAPFDYLIENPATGGKSLREQGRSYASIYEFGSTLFIPKPAELAAAKDAIRNHLAQVPLEGPDRLAGDLFLQGDFLAGFFNRLLAQGLYSSALFDNWAQCTQPAALVVGNPVFESYALHAARKRSIPTVVLQHGILGDFCQFIDPPVDHYIVRGWFWRQFLSPAAAAKAKVLNPAQSVGAPLLDSANRRAVLFLTAPYSMQEFWHSDDLADILRVLLRATCEMDAELIVRVHPLEELSAYEARVAELGSKLTPPAKVTFSQGTSLDPLLERSAVAVTFSSAAFLDCLRHRVPIVSFRWHDFSYRLQLEKHGVFHFAESLGELRQILKRAVRGDLRPFSGDVGPFLESTQSDDLRRGLGCCVTPKSEKASVS